MSPFILVLLFTTAIHGQEPCPLGKFPEEVASGCCGVDSTTVPYIVGGVPTVPGQYPWLAALEYLDGKEKTPTVHCGGSLISGLYVLTAAHCMKDGEPHAVRLGEYDIGHEGPDCREDEKSDCTDGAITVIIENIKIHEKYGPHDENRNHAPVNDIALLRLEEVVHFTDFIRPICLPTVDVNDLWINGRSHNYDLYTAGWGDTMYENIYPNRNITRHVNMPLQHISKCATAFGVVVDDLIVCAGGLLGKDSCHGDSGGPLMRIVDGRYDLVGVLSYGHRQCGSGSPAGYTNVFKYRHWIWKNL